MLGVILLLLGVVAFAAPNIYIRVGKGPDVTYQSSDGGWTDFECNMKGRDFKIILSSFNAYKEKNNKPGVTLKRVTKKPKIYNLSWWFADFSDPKWEVTYVKRHIPSAKTDNKEKRIDG